MHHRLLDEFPAHFARLVDKGFTHCTGAYRNFLMAYFPARVVNGAIDVEGVKDSRKQSADRYIVEVFFARVKTYHMLKDRAPWAGIKFLDDAWNIALAATDLNAFLRNPNDVEEVEARLVASASRVRKVVNANRAKWGTTAVPSYLQGDC